MYATDNVVQGKFTKEQYDQLEQIADKAPKANVKYAYELLKISLSELREWYALNEIPEQMYVTLLLRMARVGSEVPEDFDINRFCEEAAVEKLRFEEESGKLVPDVKKNGDIKLKHIKASSVRAVIAKMQKNGRATFDGDMISGLRIYND